MKSITDKILLGFLIIGMIGVSSFLITAFTPNTQEDKMVTQQLSNSVNQISLDDARNIALSVVSGEVTEIEYQKINGKMFYDVEITHDGMETDVQIDPRTGEIVSMETEVADVEITSKELELIDGLITQEQAIQIAIDYFGEGSFREFESEREGSTIIYEITLRVGDDFMEVEIDAETGRIIEVEEAD